MDLSSIQVPLLLFREYGKRSSKRGIAEEVFTLAEHERAKAFAHILDELSVISDSLTEISHIQTLTFRLFVVGE